MALETFKEWTPSPQNERLLMVVNTLVKDWAAQGYNMTLRQIYYQLVAANTIANTPNSYKNLSAILKRARMSGLMDWNHMEDRTRQLSGYNYSTDMSDFLQARVYDYHIDRWKANEYHLEVWVEKDALKDIIGQACSRLHVDYMSCRGYVSATAIKTAADRFKYLMGQGKKIVVLHMGDHDPSGLDMSRDMAARLEQMGAEVDFKRIALSLAQIRQYKLPANPAKIKDKRAAAYIERFGRDSWELDALKPDVLTQLVETNIKKYLEQDLFSAAEKQEVTNRTHLTLVGKRFDQVGEFLEAFDETTDPHNLLNELEQAETDAANYEQLYKEYEQEATENAQMAEEARRERSAALLDLEEERKQRAVQVKLLEKQLKAAQSRSEAAGEVLEFPAEVGELYTKGKQQRIFRGVAGDWAMWAVPSKPAETKAGNIDKARKWFGGAKHE